MIERRRITDRASWLQWRSQDLTASDIGAVAGVDPHRSMLTIYAEKTGQILAAEETPIMRRGRWLEAATLEALRENYPTWRIERAGIYLRDTEIRLGATPDFLAEDPEDPGVLINIQAKAVGKPTWLRDWWGDTRYPLAYGLQTLAEGLLLGAGRNLLVALVIDTYSADLDIIEIDRHPAAEQRIVQTAIDFWANIAAGRRPAPDYSRDAETIVAMFPHADTGTVLDLSADNRLAAIMPKRAALKDKVDEGMQALLEIDAEIKDKLGAAEAATLPGWRLSWKEEHRKAYTVAESTRRVLRVSEAKENGS
jgi:predicted phage-related endonuclease